MNTFEREKIRSDAGAVLDQTMAISQVPSHNPQRAKVVEALQHTWGNYFRYAFGKDEFLPISGRTQNWANGNGIGATVVDALDTLLLAGLHKEAEDAIEWVDKQLSFDQDIKVSVFETTIRVLGGLLSSFQITGREPLKRQATDLGSRLLRAFDTPSGVPDNYVNLRTGRHEGAAWNGGLAILSELGSLQMEFRTLSAVTGDPRFDRAAQKAIDAIRSSCNSLCPRNFMGSLPRGAPAGLGSFGDSFYEYLLKYWILSGKSSNKYKTMWDLAAKHIVQTTSSPGGRLIPNGQETGNVMEHLACFSGGLFALSYIQSGDEEHLRVARGVAETCHAMYTASKSGLSADVVRIDGNGHIFPSDPKFILRPETVETYFYLYRATKDPKYRLWGEEFLDACNKHLRVERGFVGASDVNRVPVPHNDMLETFWLAETLKYLLLLFSDDDALRLDEWVFNTEAHPFRLERSPYKRESSQIQ
jgi:mannosyl-oligosaccharide alpha-1,2-mannosidase